MRKPAPHYTKLNNIGLDFLGGTFLGSQIAMFGLTWAVLLFSGALESYQREGTTIILIGSAMMVLIMALASSLRITAACPQDTAGVFGLVLLPTVLSVFHSKFPESSPLLTVIVALGVMTFVTAALFLAVGFLNLGKLIQFVPYPVLGGFLAGTGWLLIQGGLSIVLDKVTLSSVFNVNNLIFWVPAFLYALLITSLTRRCKSYRYLPILIVLSLVIFYTGLYLTGTSLLTAKNNGFMLTFFQKSTHPMFSSLNQSSPISWNAILSKFDIFLAAAFINLSALLLRLASLELITHQSINIRRELVSCGFANLMVGSIGCFAGYHSLSFSVLNYKMGVTSRLTGFIACVFCVGLWLFLVTGFIQELYLPRYVFAVLLFFQGFSFLQNWLIDIYKSVSRLDYFLVLFILTIIIYFGILTGVSLGIILSLIIFVVRYSKTGAIKSSLTGNFFPSSTQRGASELALLKTHGGTILILLLQGYLFFGNSDTLTDYIKKECSAKGKDVKYIILDYRLVKGFDISAAISFIKLWNYIHDQDISLVLTHIAPETLSLINNTFSYYEITPQMLLFPSLDHGLEWCENQILMKHELQELPLPNIIELIHELLPDIKDTNNFIKYLQRNKISKGQIIYKQGDRSDEMCFLEKGEAEIYREIDADNQIRLSTLRAGTVIGEMGFYLKTVRSATVIAKSDVIIHRLSHDAFQQMEQEDATIAGSFHAAIVRLLAKRLLHANLIIHNLLT